MRSAARDGGISCRFRWHQVASGYMAPTIGIDDLVEIDTTVTRADQDGIYLVTFRHGEPALRRVQLLPDGQARVLCDSAPAVPDLMRRQDLNGLILGKATRVFSGHRVGCSGKPQPEAVCGG